MIAQRKNEWISLSVLPWPRFNSQYFKGFFLWLITLRQTTRSQCGEKMAQSPLIGTTQPEDIEKEGQSPTMDRPWLK